MDLRFKELNRKLRAESTNSAPGGVNPSSNGNNKSTNNGGTSVTSPSSSSLSSGKNGRKSTGNNKNDINTRGRNPHRIRAIVRSSSSSRAASSSAMSRTANTADVAQLSTQQPISPKTKITEKANSKVTKQTKKQKKKAKNAVSRDASSRSRSRFRRKKKPNAQAAAGVKKPFDSVGGDSENSSSPVTQKTRNSIDKAEIANINGNITQDVVRGPSTFMDLETSSPRHSTQLSSSVVRVDTRPRTGSNFSRIWKRRGNSPKQRRGTSPKQYKDSNQQQQKRGRRRERVEKINKPSAPKKSMSKTPTRKPSKSVKVQQQQQQQRVDIEPKSETETSNNETSNNETRNTETSNTETSNNEISNNETSNNKTNNIQSSSSQTKLSSTNGKRMRRSKTDDGPGTHAQTSPTLSSSSSNISVRRRSHSPAFRTTTTHSSSTFVPPVIARQPFSFNVSVPFSGPTTMVHESSSSCSSLSRPSASSSSFSMPDLSLGMTPSPRYSTGPSLSRSFNDVSAVESEAATKAEAVRAASPVRGNTNHRRSTSTQALLENHAMPIEDPRVPFVDDVVSVNASPSVHFGGVSEELDSLRKAKDAFAREVRRRTSTQTSGSGAVLTGVGKDARTASIIGSSVVGGSVKQRANGSSSSMGHLNVSAARRTSSSVRRTSSNTVVLHSPAASVLPRKTMEHVVGSQRRRVNSMVKKQLSELFERQKSMSLAEVRNRHNPNRNKNPETVSESGESSESMAANGLPVHIGNEESDVVHHRHSRGMSSLSFPSQRGGSITATGAFLGRSRAPSEQAVITEEHEEQHREHSFTNAHDRSMAIALDVALKAQQPPPPPPTIPSPRSPPPTSEKKKKNKKKGMNRTTTDSALDNRSRASSFLASEMVKISGSSSNDYSASSSSSFAESSAGSVNVLQAPQLSHSNLGGSGRVRRKSQTKAFIPRTPGFISKFLSSQKVKKENQRTVEEYRKSMRISRSFAHWNEVDENASASEHESDTTSLSRKLSKLQGTGIDEKSSTDLTEDDSPRSSTKSESSRKRKSSKANSARLLARRSFRPSGRLNRSGTGTSSGESGAPAVYHLPRGGVYVQTSAGAVQFGQPPETVKDSMEMGLAVPTIFVIPRERFDLLKGVSVSEIEFPAFFNYFVLQKRVTFVTYRDAHEDLMTIMKESLDGPDTEFLYSQQEYSHFCPQEIKDSAPDHLKEMTHFQQPRGPGSPGLSIEQLIDFRFFDEEGKIDLGNGVIIRDNEELSSYSLEDSNRQAPVEVLYQEVESSVVPESIRLKATPPCVTGSEGTGTFKIPTFGLTVLGNSHGFDPSGSTSGFVVWINGQGVMVDPPPHSSELLLQAGIEPKAITATILTHCHADHDAGTFQKMITESKITLMTTATVFESFKRKYSAVSGLHPQFIQKLVTFRPMFLDEPNIWNGASFRFFYSLHSIPCVGFQVSLEDKSLVYSGDTFYDPAGLKDMRDSGVLSTARYNRLLDFPWHCDVVLHEAGVPPIHTPVEALAQLPEESKRNIHLIHIDGNAARVAGGLGFRVASPGVENTIILLEQKAEHGMLKFLQLIGSMEIFRHFEVNKALELMLMCSEARYPAGSLIARKDDPGNKFIILLEGVASVTFDGVKKVFRSGDYLGEISSTTGQARSASILAETNVIAMEMDQYALNYLMMNDRHLRTRLEHVVHARSDGSWQAIAHNGHLSMLTTAQKTQIQALLTRRTVKRGDVIWARGDSVTEAVLIQSGALIFEEVHGTVEEVVAGMGRLRSRTSTCGDTKSLTFASVTYKEEEQQQQIDDEEEEGEEEESERVVLLPEDGSSQSASAVVSADVVTERRRAPIISTSSSRRRTDSGRQNLPSKRNSSVQMLSGGATVAEGSDSETESRLCRLSGVVVKSSEDEATGSSSSSGNDGDSDVEDENETVGVLCSGRSEERGTEQVQEKRSRDSGGAHDSLGEHEKKSSVLMTANNSNINNCDDSENDNDDADDADDGDDADDEDDDDDDDNWTLANANQALLSTGMMLFDLLGINDERPLTTTLVCASKTAQIFTLDADAMLLFLDTNPLILLALLKTPILT